MSEQSQQRQFPCKNCGANLEFAPGQNALKCPYCGALNEIAAPTEAVDELDFRAAISQELQSAEMVDVLTVHCDTCGAETTLKPNVTAQRCPFCGSGIVAQAMSKRIIKPKSLLPFHVTREQSQDAFKQWLAARWFAPSDLTKRAEHESLLTGVYIPSWTYDSNTVTPYTGQRGDDYWTTETYTTMVNGRSETRTRQVRRTRWSYASGTVYDTFDDILVLASRSLPKKYADALEPWDLKNLVPYRAEYLSGFQAESYQVDLKDGFEVAKGIMAGFIQTSIRRDIGGDHQRISSMDTNYREITFKHTLLPIWISAYLYQAKVFRFLVNARTGEVQGERPYSWIKITLFVLMCIAILAVVLLVVQNR